MWSVSPAAIAGLHFPGNPSGRRNVRTAQQKLSLYKLKHVAAPWTSQSFEKQ
jgi:hypothetical protein